MRKRANTTLVGAFVVGAVALMAVGTMLLGGGRFWEHRTPFVIYFDESIKNLNVGAPVTFQGVKIGEVTNIFMQMDSRSLEFYIPVIIELHENKVLMINTDHAKPSDDVDDQELARALIHRGLRAQLRLSSPLTGQRYIDLGFYPRGAPRLRGAEIEGNNIAYTEFPAIPSDLEAVVETIQELPLKEIIFKVQDVLVGLDAMIRETDLPELVRTADETLRRSQVLMDGIGKNVEALSQESLAVLGATRSFVRNTDQRLAPLLAGAQNAVSEAQAAFTAAGKTFGLEEGRAAELADRFHAMAVSASETLEHSRRVLLELESLAGDSSPLMYNLNDMLREIAMMARAFREAADMILRNPEVLLRGQKPEIEGR